MQLVPAFYAPRSRFATLTATCLAGALVFLSASSASATLIDIVVVGTWENTNNATINPFGLTNGDKFVMKSTYAGELSVNVSSLVVDEITLVGSRCGPFAPALKLLAEGTIDPRPLIAGRYPLREALAAFDHARKAGSLKVLLEIGQPG